MNAVYNDSPLQWAEMGRYTTPPSPFGASDSRKTMGMTSSIVTDSHSVIGVDIGGTFTDFVYISPAGVDVDKRLTSPASPALTVLAGIGALLRRYGDPSPKIIHGSTVATNAVLERKGAAVALITTEGFTDVIEIGRQNRPRLYDLSPHRVPPLVSRELRFEVHERVTADGEIEIPLTAVEAETVADAVAATGAESCAVCLLFSFARPEHEEMIGATLRDRGLAVSLSSRVLPEFREYERSSTTVANAYVQPLMKRYLDELAAGVQARCGASLRVMQSNGGVITSATAGDLAVRTLLSGPAGGVIGARAIAAAAGIAQTITFDMGGTSTDMALCPGEPQMTTEATIGGLPVGVQMIDIHTVGAGGGSIVRLDAGGALQVGPASAGADPGPTCYGRGSQPTVTDANLLLGRIDPARFAGGTLPLDPARARAAFEPLCKQTGLSVEQLAAAAVAVAESNMERALRVISVERGYDPRDFTLVSFGGAGSLHAAALAESLGMRRVLIPRLASVLSAYGMAIADLVRDYSATVMTDDLTDLPTCFQRLEQQALAEFAAETAEMPVLHRSVDMRYRGQSYELNVDYGEDISRRFHDAHRRRHGYSWEDEPVVAVTVRVRAVMARAQPELPTIPRNEGTLADAVLDRREDATVYDGERLPVATDITGPALISQPLTNVWVPAGWTAELDEYANLLLERAEPDHA